VDYRGTDIYVLYNWRVWFASEFGYRLETVGSKLRWIGRSLFYFERLLMINIGAWDRESYGRLDCPRYGVEQ